MSLLNAAGAPMSTPQISPEQVTQLMTGLRIRIDAANAQLVQLGLLVEYLYENLEKQGTVIPMDEFPEWAKNRYTEIQEQAKQAMAEGNDFAEQVKSQVKEEIANIGINLDDNSTEANQEAVSNEE